MFKVKLMTALAMSADTLIAGVAAGFFGGRKYEQEYGGSYAARRARLIWMDNPPVVNNYSMPTPRRNECWLLETPDAAHPRFRVLVLDVDTAGGLAKAAPFFVNDDDALPGDRLLAEECDFLPHGAWLAVDLAEWAPMSRFYKRLGILEQGTVTRLLGGDAVRGRSFLPGLGDPREEARAGFARHFRQATAATLMESVINLGRLVLGTPGEFGKAAAFTAGAASVVGGGVLAGILARVAAPARVRGTSEGGAAFSFTDADGREYGLVLNPAGEGWSIQFVSKHPVAAAVLKDASGNEFAGQPLGAWRVFGDPMSPLAPGDCLLRWRRDAGEKEFRSASFTLPELPENAGEE